MPEKIQIYPNKTLKLTNLLSRDLSQQEFLNIEKIAYMLKGYASSKGAKAKEPLIIYNKSLESNDYVKCKIIMQLDKAIEAEPPYDFNEEFIQKNCLFSRFEENESHLNLAYKKMIVYGFENDVFLRGDSYTVFVSKEENGFMLTDIFMPLEI